MKDLARLSAFIWILVSVTKIIKGEEYVLTIIVAILFLILAQIAELGKSINQEEKTKNVQSTNQS